ncbi:MAG: zinc-ribbon domain-containing protein [Desulfobacterota bacterium]|nr:zinc-ribbon domain-containing protein [Thermodesulfobacteriota bacterium]
MQKLSANENSLPRPIWEIKAMENIKFYEIRERVRKKMGLPPIPFPVRESREKVIFKSQGVALDLLLDELERYLIEHPEERVLYRETFSRLAAMEGIRLGEEGFHELASHYFELGLALDPENLSLRANYALALQSSGRKEEAMKQYRLLIQQPQISGQFLVLIPAARLFLDSGDPVTAHQILRHCASFMPLDDEFWELYAEVRERCGLKPWMAPGQKKPGVSVAPVQCPEAKEKEKKNPKKNFCSACGKPVKPTDKFCGSCGHAL